MYAKDRGRIGAAGCASLGGEPVSEQQRATVAWAIAKNPVVLLADGPPTALDGRLGREVMELFRKVAHEQQAGVVVVTHDHRSLDIFDRIYEMEDGVVRPAASAGVVG